MCDWHPSYVRRHGGTVRSFAARLPTTPSLYPALSLPRPSASPAGSLLLLVSAFAVIRYRLLAVLRPPHVLVCFVRVVFLHSLTVRPSPRTSRNLSSTQYPESSSPLDTILASVSVRLSSSCVRACVCGACALLPSDPLSDFYCPTPPTLLNACCSTPPPRCLPEHHRPRSLASDASWYVSVLPRHAPFHLQRPHLLRPSPSF